MKDFTQWASENKYDLAAFSEVPTTSEDNKRGGFSAQYGKGYVASQYPAGYFAAIKSTAALDDENMNGKGKKKKQNQKLPPA